MKLTSPPLWAHFVLCLTLAACAGPPSASLALSADTPLHLEQHLDAATVIGSDVPDALRVTLTEGTRNPDGQPRGGIVLQVPNLDYDDLAHLVMRARTTDDVRQFAVQFNCRDGSGAVGPATWS